MARRRSTHLFRDVHSFCVMCLSWECRQRKARTEYELMAPHLQERVGKSLRLLEAAEDSFSLPEDIDAAHPGSVLSLLHVKPLTGQSHCSRECPCCYQLAC